MANALEDALKMFQGMGNSVRRIGQGIGNVVETFSNSPQTIPQDWQYRTRKLSQQYQQANPALIKVPYRNEPNIYEQSQERQWENASPIGKLAIDSVYGENSWNPVKTESAQANPYYFQAPPEDKFGKKLKQSIINNPNFLPGAKDYLQTVPFQGENLYEQHAAGRAMTGSMGQPFIQYDKNLANSKTDFPQKVAAHELLHQAVGVFGIKELGSFVKDFQQAAVKNPQKYAGILKWIQGYKNNPHYKERGYFKDPSTEANELFAQIGAEFGPEMVNDPNLGGYYQKVFSAQPQGMTATPLRVNMGSGIAKLSKKNKVKLKVKGKK